MWESFVSLPGKEHGSGAPLPAWYSEKGLPFGDLQTVVYPL